jgi:fumarate reductase subunit C
MNHRHTEYHPRWYRTRVSTYWWMGSWHYLAFILRELSSAFVGWTIVFMLMHIHAISQGETAYREFVVWCRHPVVLVLNVVALFFVVFHAATWFNLAPKAMVVKMGGQRVPPVAIIAGNYAMWAAVSALVAWLVLRG